MTWMTHCAEMKTERASRPRACNNRMTPCDGSGSAVARPANDLPMPIRGDAPENPDPHSHGRLSNNLSKKPFERPGSHYTEEIRRRVHGRDVKYR
jgi:hypothetical protein